MTHSCRQHRTIDIMIASTSHPDVSQVRSLQSLDGLVCAVSRDSVHPKSHVHNTQGTPDHCLRPLKRPCRNVLNLLNLLTQACQAYQTGPTRPLGAPHTQTP